MTTYIWTDRGFERLIAPIRINIAFTFKFNDEFNSLGFATERDYENFIRYLVYCHSWDSFSSQGIWLFGTDIRIDKRIQWLRDLHEVFKKLPVAIRASELMIRATDLMIAEIRGMVK